MHFYQFKMIIFMLDVNHIVYIIHALCVEYLAISFTNFLQITHILLKILQMAKINLEKRI